MRERAPAKINRSLYVGPVRPDGRHEIVSLMQSIALADELRLEDGDGCTDEVLCPGVEGPNLAAQAMAVFRAATGWEGPAQRLRIDKRIPVAAGMAGGSADAAATLRLMARRSGVGAELLAELAAALGSDVPAQLRPGCALARGAGERVLELADPRPYGVLVLPSTATLATAAVYAEADRLGLPRSADELARVDPFAPAPVNDLEPAALSLEPSIALSLERAHAAGAEHALVCGSGPTVIGLFAEPSAAADAARALREAGVDARASVPVIRHNSR